MTTFRKVSTGNYIGRDGKYYIFIVKRESYFLSYIVGEKGWVMWVNKSITTIEKVKDWVAQKIKTA